MMMTMRTCQATYKQKRRAKSSPASKRPLEDSLLTTVMLNGVMAHSALAVAQLAHTRYQRTLQYQQTQSVLRLEWMVDKHLKVSSPAIEAVAARPDVLSRLCCLSSIKCTKHLVNVDSAQCTLATKPLNTILVLFEEWLSQREEGLAKHRQCARWPSEGFHSGKSLLADCKLPRDAANAEGQKGRRPESNRQP